MRGGELRNRVEIEKLQGTRNPDGGVTQSWVNFATVWAGITPTVGRETEQGQQFIAEATHKIKIRFLPGITEEMRIKKGTRLFDILHIADSFERHKEHILTCKEAKQSHGT